MALKTKKYTPSVSYNGKELAFKDIPIKLLSYLFIIVSTLTSCKSHSVVSADKSDSAKQEIVDSVVYEIVTDSLSCEDKNNPYRFRYVKTKHEDKIIRDKLNSSLLTINWEEVKSLETYEQTLNSLKQYLNEVYCESPIDWNEVFVVYNDNYYLTVEYQNNDRYRSLYNFDLKTGTLLNTKNIFKTPNEVAKILEIKIKKELVDLINKETEEEIKNSLQEIHKNFRYEKIDLWGLGIENDGTPISNNGIYFLVYVEDPYPERHMEPNDYFLSFNELKSYLTDQFKTQIGLNKK